MRFVTISLCTLLLLSVSWGNARAEPNRPRSERINFSQEIWPILQQHCVGCHGPEEQEGQLRLDARASFHRGGISGPLFQAGHGPQSLLLQRLTTTEQDQRMPLDKNPLTAAEIQTITHWIDQGAEWPEEIGARTEPAETHWAYRAPELPGLPEVKHHHWPHHPIDFFVLAKLEREGFVPSPQAPPATRLRRLYLDLIGLPPTVEDVDAFLRDPSPAAYKALVDRLLASPRFGEKWARSWLDLARYSDSNGYQADQLRTLWAYRDWVIDALNSDMPYDQFTIEQIAGDLFPAASVSQKIATGFHRTTTCNIEAGVDPEANRTNQVIDRVNTTATVWLGTTFECAQCHNHKYDPFTQQDYYRLFAYFNNTPLEVENTKQDGIQFDFYGPKMALPLNSDQQQRRVEIESRLQAARAKLQASEAAAMPRFRDWQQDLRADKIAPTEELPAKKIEQFKKTLAKRRKKRSDTEQQQLKQHFFDTHPATRPLRKQVAELEEEFRQTDPSTTLVMVEMNKMRPTHIFKRGMYLAPGLQVEMGVPAALHPLSEKAEQNRLGLARWLVDPRNPLIGRVRVNHLWSEIFGTGLVASAEDFGSQGTPPSHPQLLDWLAVTFRQEGWSTKRLLRQIVTSATYQQSSRIPAADHDPENRLLARGPRFRLPAETIRDNGLSIAGLLEETMGGPPVYPHQPAGLWHQTGRGEPVYEVAQDSARHRRGVYVVWRRVAPYPSFVNFDAPDRTRCIVSRSRTNTPIQALTLLNDEAYVEMARALAARILDVDLVGDEPRLVRAFKMCVARNPGSEEIRILRALLDEQRQRLRGSPEAVQELTRNAYLPKDTKNPEDPQEWAAWICVANTLLNLDETISKD